MTVPTRVRAVATLAIGVAMLGFFFMWLDRKNIGDEFPNSMADRDPPDANDAEEFPEFVSSSDQMLQGSSAKLVVEIQDADGLPLKEAPYCVVFDGGDWLCGVSDLEGKTHPVNVDDAHKHRVVTYDEAVAFWRGTRRLPPVDAKREGD